MADRNRRAFRVAYDGRGFRGFQRQPDVETIESVIFRGLSELDVRLNDGVPDGYSAAGRTDAEVSSVAQTICFNCPEWLKPNVMNSVLPREIRVWAWVDVPGEFSARYSAGQREYTYHLHVPCAAGDSVAKRVATRLSGEHDFQRFTADNDRTTRTISFQAERDGEFLILGVRAEGFPRQLVRRVAHYFGTIAEGDAEISTVEALVDGERDDIARIPPAPPEPLVLTGVSYDVDFQIDEVARESAQRVYEETWSSLVAQTRMSNSLVSFFETTRE